jgi:hypothetical protein
MVGVDMGQGDRGDLAAARDHRLDRRVQPGTGRIARVDEDAAPLADEVGADRLTGHAPAGRHRDPNDVVVDAVDVDIAEAPRSQARGDLVDRCDMLELLERRRGRDPHRQPSRGHLVERGTRPVPGVGGHLLADEAHLGAVGQRGREEPGVEPAGHRRRRYPA